VCKPSRSIKPAAINAVTPREEDFTMLDHDNDHLQRYLEVIDGADDELASLRGSYMSQCKGPRATIKEIKGEAREAGVNMKAFGAVLKDHREERARQKRVAALEAEDADSYEAMREQLGEFASTPLGEAALGRKKRTRGSKEGSLDSLHS
jgi:hypothetical protein